MLKIFISYSSKDRALVEELAADLDLLVDDCDVWFDRELNRSGGHEWWALILQEIRACDIFIYAATPNILKSEPCRREYAYARALSKPILPVVLAEVEYRSLPLELQKAQLVNYRDRSREQQSSLKASLRNLPPAPSLPNPPPPEPEVPLDPVAVALHKIETLTVDVDQQRLLILEIDDLRGNKACRKHVPELLKRLIARDDVLTARNLKRAQELLTQVMGVESKPAPSKTGPARTRTRAIDSPPAERAEAPAPPKPKASSAKPASVSLLLALFAWIEIPGGHGTMKTDRGVTLAIPVERYWIAKYPVTNAQYRLFIEAGGYETERWWTATGWQERQKKGWTAPRYWRDRDWNGAEQPVVGVSWYEAVAFCRWLSEATGEDIMLPTEAQWQYAAQGDDGRTYPWGKKWDCKRCNNRVSPCNSGGTTPVRAYEGKGDSPFGVVDMAGNVWEWCLTDYDTRTNDINSDATDRVQRGGSWSYDGTDGFRCDYRNRGNPDGRLCVRGFRLSRS